MSKFSTDGYTIARRILPAGRIDELAGLTAQLGAVGPGTRCLLSHGWCRQVAAELRRSARISAFVPAGHVAIQCTYFEKSAANNWLVPVHQDLSAPVARFAPRAGWGPWSQKEGSAFVQPPVDVLETFVAVRLHLDPCGADDGPLVVVPGTHLQGLMSPEAARQARARERACPAAAGDALVFRPLLLHRSGKASGTSRRRILHLLFAPAAPAPGIEWRHAA